MDPVIIVTTSPTPTNPEVGSITQSIHSLHFLCLDKPTIMIICDGCKLINEDEDNQFKSGRIT
jgi:hypothetical protein